jgi:hypothetical protein
LLKEGEGGKQSKKNTNIIFFLIPKILPISSKIKSQLPLANISFSCSFKSSDVLPLFFLKTQLKKETIFLLGTYARFITTKKESYATVNYFIYIHCHLIEEGFATSFNMPLTSRNKKYLPSWKDFLI